MWTPSGKLPKLPPINQGGQHSAAVEAKMGGMGANNNKLSDAEVKEKTIEKLRTECAKLARRVNHFQDQANDSKTKMEKVVKNLTSLFGEDQVGKVTKSRPFINDVTQIWPLRHRKVEPLFVIS